MRVVAVDSADDPRLGDYFSLTDVQLRRVLEPERGLFMAESRWVIQRALERGLIPRSVLTDGKWLPDLTEDLAEHPDVPVYVAPQPILRQITGYRLHRGALAAMQRPVERAVADVLPGARRILVLEDLVDHANVGASFRSAAALGFDAAVISPSCADPLYRRSVRTSMAAVLWLPWARARRWPEDLDLLSEQGVDLYALTPGKASRSLAEVAARPPRRLALVVGTEGEGLRQGTIDRCTAGVAIPMAHGIDSLNAAAATAVACYALGPAAAG